MRMQLAELQRRYKEKQRELARLQRRHDHEYVGAGAVGSHPRAPHQGRHLGQCWGRCRYKPGHAGYLVGRGLARVARQLGS